MFVHPLSTHATWYTTAPARDATLAGSDILDATEGDLTAGSAGSEAIPARDTVILAGSSSFRTLRLSEQYADQVNVRPRLAKTLKRVLARGLFSFKY